MALMQQTYMYRDLYRLQSYIINRDFLPTLAEVPEKTSSVIITSCMSGYARLY